MKKSVTALIAAFIIAAGATTSAAVFTTEQLYAAEWNDGSGTGAVIEHKTGRKIRDVKTGNPLQVSKTKKKSESSESEDSESEKSSKSEKESKTTESDDGKSEGTTSSSGSEESSKSKKSTPAPTPEPTKPPFDVYIKVASGDGNGLMLREQPSADAQAVLLDNIPDGTVLHITDEVIDGAGGVWGYTNYADVGSGYVLLAETQQTERTALLAPSAEEMRRLAEEERAAFIRQYFQIVDSNGNVVEDATPFMHNTEKKEETKAESTETVAENEAVSSSSLSEKAKAVLSESEGTESLKTVSSSSTRGSDGTIPFLPFKVPVFVGIIVLVVLLLVIGGVVFLLILKKKKAGASGADEEGGDQKGKKGGDKKAAAAEKKAAAAAKKAAAAEKKKAAAAAKKEAAAQKKAAAAAKKVAKKAEKDKAKADKAAAKAQTKAAKDAAKQKIKAAKEEIKAAKKGTKTAKSKAMKQSSADELKKKK